MVESYHCNLNCLLSIFIMSQFIDQDSQPSKCKTYTIKFRIKTHQSNFNQQSNHPFYSTSTSSQYQKYLNDKQLKLQSFEEPYLNRRFSLERKKSFFNSKNSYKPKFNITQPRINKLISRINSNKSVDSNESRNANAKEKGISVRYKSNNMFQNQYIARNISDFAGPIIISQCYPPETKRQELVMKTQPNGHHEFFDCQKKQFRQSKESKKQLRIQSDNQLTVINSFQKNTANQGKQKEEKSFFLIKNINPSPKIKKTPNINRQKLSDWFKNTKKQKEIENLSKVLVSTQYQNFTPNFRCLSQERMKLRKEVRIKTQQLKVRRGLFCLQMIKKASSGAKTINRSQTEQKRIENRLKKLEIKQEKQR